MAREQQTERIGLRVTPAEAKMLADLAEAVGLSMSDVLRQAIRREYAERFGEKPPGKKPRK